MKNLFATLALGALALPAAWASTTVGSFSDGSKNPADPDGPVARIFLTEWSGHTSGGSQIGGSDLLFWDGGFGVLVLYDARIFVTLPDVPLPTDPVTLTTVYGKRAGPGHVTGFANPAEFMPTSLEQHTGASGTVYTASSGSAVASGDMASVLPGFDLAPFDLAPGSTYHVFSTTLPYSEIAAVPEPQTYALWLLGLGLLGALRRRH